MLHSYPGSKTESDMQNKLKEDKQKVTLYLPHDLHRQLKIKAAVDSETMTDIAQKAIVFYLSHQDVVDQYGDGYGHNHRVYHCPECSSSVVLREGEIVSIHNFSDVLLDGELIVDSHQSLNTDSSEEEELVPC